MGKGLSFSFEQCFGQFSMLLVQGSSETRLLRHLSKNVFRSPQVQKYIPFECDLSFEKVYN